MLIIIYFLFFRHMGAEEHHGILDASSLIEAKLAYEQIAPIGFYNNEWYRITTTRTFEESFKNQADAIAFLRLKISKWCGYAAICECGLNRYAYLVLYPS